MVVSELVVLFLGIRAEQNREPSDKHNNKQSWGVPKRRGYGSGPPAKGEAHAGIGSEIQTAMRKRPRNGTQRLARPAHGLRFEERPPVTDPVRER